MIPTASAAAGSHPDRRAQVGVILAGSVPNLVQWFNLYLYATFAPYFRTEFFDPDSPDSLIYVYGLFALTFVVRPLGSWLFGRLADTRGRQRALVAAVTMMSAGSVVLALAPTERAVGAWAAVILVVVSLLQGIATGGEYAAATVLLSESGTRGHRGFFASFQATTIVGGLVLAQACLLVLLLISDRAGISEWGWRVALVAGGVAGLASLWWARGFKRGASGAAASYFRRRPDDAGRGIHHARHTSRLREGLSSGGRSRPGPSDVLGLGVRHLNLRDTRPGCHATMIDLSGRPNAIRQPQSAF